MKRAQLVGLLVLLCACSLQAPVERISHLNLPAAIASADGPRGSLDWLFSDTLNHFYLALPERSETWFVLLASSSLRDEETLKNEVVSALPDWHLAAAVNLTNRHFVLERASRSGKQTLTVSRIALPERYGGEAYGDSAIVLLTLYPVKK